MSPLGEYVGFGYYFCLQDLLTEDNGCCFTKGVDCSRYYRLAHSAPFQALCIMSCCLLKAGKQNIAFPRLPYSWNFSDDLSSNVPI